MIRLPVPCKSSSANRSPSTSLRSVAARLPSEFLTLLILQVHNENGFVRFLATMLSYGFFGDIIHQSDKWRCLGPLRYDLAGFYQFLLNRSYHSALTITLSSPDSPQLAQAATPGAMSNVADSTRATENKQVDAELRKVARDIIAPGLAFCRRNCETCALVETNETDAARSPKQIHLEGRYTTINCLNMPCRCAKSKFGMSPFVHLGKVPFSAGLLGKRVCFFRWRHVRSDPGETIVADGLSALPLAGGERQSDDRRSAECRAVLCERSSDQTAGCRPQESRQLGV